MAMLYHPRYHSSYVKALLLVIQSISSTMSLVFANYGSDTVFYQTSKQESGQLFIFISALKTRHMKELRGKVGNSLHKLVFELLHIDIGNSYRTTKKNRIVEVIA